MIGYRNPVALVRKLIASVRGLQVEEEWRVYLVVACLSVVCSALILLNVIFGQTERAISRGSGQHVKLQIDQTLFQERLPEKNVAVKEAPKEVATPVAKQQTDIKKAPPQERAEDGEWYYSEQHKEWRFKKK